MSDATRIDPDDPVVTAWAAGELAPAERAALETAAAADPALRAALDEALATATTLAGALRAEVTSDGCPVLDPARRAAVLERAANGAPVLSLTARLRRWGLFAAAAACVAAFGVIVATKPWSPQGGRQVTVAKVGSSDEARTPSSGPDPTFFGTQPNPDGTLFVGRAADASSAPAAEVLIRRAERVETLKVDLNGIHVVPSPAPGPKPRPVAETGSGGGGGGVSTFTSGSGATPGYGGAAGVMPVPPPVTYEVPGLSGSPANPGTRGFLLFSGDGDNGGNRLLTEMPDRAATGTPEAPGTESYRAYVENAFLLAKGAPLSTFSIDVDTASWSNVRRMIGDGHLPPADAVRVEELVNYFPYAYAAPTGPDPFAVHLEVAGCPWNTKHRLVRVGIKGREVARAERPASNLVFLLDVSGSMDAPNKLPLVKASMRMLLDGLNERDHVAIVVYAGASGLALAPTSCEQKAKILHAIDTLVASGSTNGAAGITLAYEQAIAGFIPGGVNRVVLCTDGDFNVGVTSRDDLLKLISEQAKSKVFLTALGFGMGNYKDDTLELLADRGNGNYGYIDTTREAHKVLVAGASGTLQTIAKDVKLQVEFNPATVAAYRLVGYDNRLLAAKDFADDTKDAGEIGAGHTVTALYEVVPVGALPEAPPVAKPDVDPLRYGPKPPPPPPPAPVVDSPLPSSAPDTVAAELLTVKLRFKAPEGDVSTKREFPLTDGGGEYAKASEDFRFASAVAAFALLLKGSPFRGTANLDTVVELGASAIGADPGGWRAEFVELAKKARTLSGVK